ncbi:MAG: sulfite exporter TauE/SafE family protein [Bacteroidetes bacterium]|nr:sulfite exporter TauE/SafE family protein [Bacteroidota bacterium]
MDVFYWTALSVGFFGSFHCAGMCGPLAMALPTGNGSILNLLGGRIAYNLGRVVTYSILGTIAGFLGKTLSIRGWQSDISILSGILIIVMVLLTNQKILTKINHRFAGFSFQLKKVFGKLLKHHSIASLFSFGVVNGILPCGFVYLAMAGAATTKSPMEGATYMFLFGLGTVPMMLTLALSGSFISIKARNFVNKITPVIAIALAIFLIHRGSMMKEEEQSCCKPGHMKSFEVHQQK